MMTRVLIHSSLKCDSFGCKVFACAAMSRTGGAPCNVLLRIPAKEHRRSSVFVIKQQSKKAFEGDSVKLEYHRHGSTLNIVMSFSLLKKYFFNYYLGHLKLYFQTMIIIVTVKIQRALRQPMTDLCKHIVLNYNYG